MSIFCALPGCFERVTLETTIRAGSTTERIGFCSAEHDQQFRTELRLREPEQRERQEAKQ